MTDCIEHRGKKSTSGYGCSYINRHHVSAHRVSYILFKGIIPRNKCVLHKCNNRVCINPEHLYLGTHKDNAVDREQAGTTAKGTRNGQSKLNWVKVRSIRSLAKKGVRKYQIGRLHGVSDNVVCRIVKNELWKI